MGLRIAGACPLLKRAPTLMEVAFVCRADAQHLHRPERQTASLRSLFGSLVASLLGARSCRAFGVSQGNRMVRMETASIEGES